MNKEILATVESTITALIQLVDSFKPEHFNRVPFEGSWTPAQVSDHIGKSLSAIAGVMKGAANATARPAGKKNEMIKSFLLDFDTKMSAPDFIIPSNAILEKESMVQSLKTITLNLVEAVKTMDLSEICISFELPGVGKFTKYEWAHFAVYHTQRHLHQLRNIQESLATANH
ncbi:MAG TPA: DinB family protein [Agriterribacter sp.]|nr:DinB family protein [Agriterribacter sp.]